MSANDRKQTSMRGWLILMSTLLLQACVFSIASSMHSQFTSYVLAGEGFSYATFSIMFTVGSVVSAVAQPFIGKSYGKFPIKMIFLVGTLVSMGGILFLSISHAYWMFYLGYAMAQTGIAAVSSLGAPMLITSWFGPKLRGRALGITFAGGSIGNMVLQSTVVKLLADPNYGYSYAYRITGLVGLVVGVVVILLFVRMPKDQSEILGAVDAEEAAKTAAANQQVEVWGYTAKEVRQYKFYWIYCVGFVFIGLYIIGLLMNFATYLNAIGVPSATVGTVGTIYALFCLIGNVGGGTLIDKVGIKPSMLIAGICVALGAICLLLTPYCTTLAFGFSIFIGLSCYHYMSGPSVMARSAFGNKEFAPILAIGNIFFAVGYAIGSPLFAAVAENISFEIGWIYCIICLVLAYLCIFGALNFFGKLNKEKFGK